MRAFHDLSTEMHRSNLHQLIFPLPNLTFGIIQNTSQIFEEK